MKRVRSSKYGMREIRSTWKYVIDSYSKSLLWIWKIDRILLQMLPFVLMLGLHPRPDQLVEHTAQLRFAGNYYFLNSEELNFTICFHHSLKCTKIDCGWGSAPDPAGGAYRAPRKIIVWISKVFIPSNALYSCRMRQTLWWLGLRPRTHSSSYITAIFRKIWWIWNICMQFILCCTKTYTISFWNEKKLAGGWGYDPDSTEEAHIEREGFHNSSTPSTF